jgi:PQQ-like domain
MTWRNVLRVLALAAGGLAAALPRAAGAGVPATLNTTIAASTVTTFKKPSDAANVNKIVDAETIPLSANQRKQRTGWADLTFPLDPLPKDAALTVCAIRLVISDAIPPGQDNGVLLELFKGPALAAQTPEPVVAAKNVPPGTKAGTAIVLRSRNLCSALKPADQQGQPSSVQFHLQTSIRDGNIPLVGWFGKDYNSYGRVPRLLLTYTLANALPGDADWSQIRRDAQHTGRSAWRMFDPDGAYMATSFKAVALSAGGVVAGNLGDLHQSPLLYGGKIFSVQDKYRLIARDRSGAILGEVTREQKPKYLAAGGRGWLYYVEENVIHGYDLKAGLFSGADDLPTMGETMVEVPTVGADGSLYVVTNRYVRAFSPPPKPQELWRYETQQTEDIGAVTLSADGKTAYVLFGGTAKPRLVALDSATGDCRWSGPVSAIDRGPNEPMPPTVVAGHDILFTRAFPSSNTLYVFHDGTPEPPDPDRGALVPPVLPAACGEPPLKTEVRAGEHIATPVALANDEAVYISGGKFCRSRGETAGETCSDLNGCSQADAKEIDLLVADSGSERNRFTHLYGLASEKKRLFFISWGQRANDKEPSAKCSMTQLDRAGPNLILGIDGTLYNSADDLLQTFVPNLPDMPQELTLEEELLRKNNNSAFRTPFKISTSAKGLVLGADTDITLIAGSGIEFKPGFEVKQGARLRAGVSGSP